MKKFFWIAIILILLASNAFIYWLGTKTDRQSVNESQGYNLSNTAEINKTLNKIQNNFLPIFIAIIVVILLILAFVLINKA